MPDKKNLLIGVSGGIAAFKVCTVASYFTKMGVNVNVVVTEHGAEFVTPLTFEALTKNPCLTSLFDGKSDDPVAHVNLGRTADCVLIAPATANVIAKLANGIADDMLTSTVLAASCKKLVAPAMFTGMLENPATQRNLARLREDGFEIIEAEAGRLACGAVGSGRLAEPEVLISAVEQALFGSTVLKNKRVLITAGATREDIDPVRYITNHSSGKMGYALAKAARSMGAEVELVSGNTAIMPPYGVSTVFVSSAEEMYNAVLSRAQNADIIVMAAAVADYTPTNYSDNKVKKSDGDMSIPLKRTRDILKYLGENRVPGQVICGFSMETQNMVENSREKLVKKNVDMICANNLKQSGAGFGVDTNVITIITRNETTELPLQTKEGAANAILDAALRLTP